MVYAAERIHHVGLQDRLVAKQAWKVDRDIPLRAPSEFISQAADLVVHPGSDAYSPDHIRHIVAAEVTHACNQEQFSTAPEHIKMGEKS
jgi:hypothetical protein